MKFEIIYAEDVKWSKSILEDIIIISIGSYWYDGAYYSGKKANIKLIEIFQLNAGHHFQKIKEIISEHLKGFSGHFSFIVITPAIGFAVVDKIRSFPIYYFRNDNNIYFSNSAPTLQRKFSLKDYDPSSILIFKMAGYTIGDSTILVEIKQLQSAEIIIVDLKTNSVSSNRYFRYFVDKTSTESEENLLEELHGKTIKTFTKMITSLNGAPVWIPLSGGLDSRLILALLLELKYDNITTYTYGKSGIWEIERAKFIAEFLNVKWHFIKFNPLKIRKYFNTFDRKKYFNYAGGLNSAPHLAEYYALLELRRKNYIPENAVIINGQSGDFTSGGHIPKLLLENNSEKIDINTFLKVIIDKHYSLWSNLNDISNNKIISDEIIRLLDLFNKKVFTKDQFAKYYELHECEERQAKFVVNGQRAYDWFGYEWRLPLWSDELIEFWMKVDWKIKFGQGLLLKYLKKYNFGKVFEDITLPPQFSYYPLWIKLLRPAITSYSKISSNQPDYLYRKYFLYFMTYSPMYPQSKFSEYLEDSKYHRNTVSYFSKYYLMELFNTNEIH
ncbi:MAG: asparagine synthetase B family protein [Ignavibacteria bacterium]